MHKYATEKVRTIPANTPFSILGSTQMSLMAKLIGRLDKGHRLLDRFMFGVPLCLRPTEEAKQSAIKDLEALEIKDFLTLFNVMYNKTAMVHTHSMLRRTKL